MSALDFELRFPTLTGITSSPSHDYLCNHHLDLILLYYRNEEEMKISIIYFKTNEVKIRVRLSLLRVRGQGLGAVTNVCST